MSSGLSREYEGLSLLNSATFCNELLFHAKNVFNQIHRFHFLASADTSHRERSSAQNALQNTLSATR